MTPAEDEFSAFVAASFPALLRTAYLVTGDRQLAEDLVQTVLARLYLKWDSLADVRERDLIAAYARTAVIRTATSWWRRAWRRERPGAALSSTSWEADLGGSTPSGRTADFTATSAERDRLLRHLSDLSPRQRAAIVLRYYEDLSEADTAAALGCSVGSVKTHTHRGLERLRELLGAELAREASNVQRETSR